MTLNNLSGKFNSDKTLLQVKNHFIGVKRDNNKARVSLTIE